MSVVICRDKVSGSIVVMYMRLTLEKCCYCTEVLGFQNLLMDIVKLSYLNLIPI